MNGDPKAATDAGQHFAKEAPAHWCKKMRWKSHGNDQHDPRRVLHVFQEGSVIYTCLSTAQVMGPDGGLCAPERCTDKRGCYVRHPALDDVGVA